jgi:plastocyanin
LKRLVVGKEGCSVKKRVAGIVVLFGLIMATLTSGSIDILAASIDGSEPTEKAGSIVIELNDDFFNPKEIMIPSGTTTTLILKNKGKKKHTFTVENLGVDTEVQPGQETSITVEPKQPGTYDLICRYHYQEGMVGKIIVK